MKSTTFDQTTKLLATGETRRGVLRGLAAGLGLAATGVVGATSAEAKRGNKKKPKKTCRPGTVVGVVPVPATGGTVQTPMLRKGQAYRLRAVGSWSTNATYQQDATAAYLIANPNAPERTFQGVRLGLSVDGGSPDQWGPYNTGHVYERVVTGRGRRLSLRNTDPVTTDNSGFLNVEVRCK